MVMRFVIIAFAFFFGLSHAAVIDFAGYQAGDRVTQMTVGGVRISVNAAAYNGLTRAMIFDARNPTGGDWDLAGPFADVRGGASIDPGNILIISEDGDASDPDDRARGGWIEFLFEVPVTFNAFDAFDMNHRESLTVTLYGENGMISQITNDYVGYDNSFEHIVLDQGGVTRAVFNLKSSGAIGNLAFNAYQTPVPASGLLLGSAIALVALRGRKARAAQA